MDDSLLNIIVAAVSAAVGFVAVKVIKSLRLKKECLKLAEAAKTVLKESGYDMGHQAWELTSVHRAVKERDKDMLGAYARLLGSNGALHISLAVCMVKMVKLNNPSTPLSVESLTAEQVTAFHEVRGKFTLEDDEWGYLDSPASLTGAYAMENLDDYPLVLSIVKRGVTSLDEIKAMVAEIKANKVVALSDGML